MTKVIAFVLSLAMLVPTIASAQTVPADTAVDPEVAQSAEELAALGMTEEEIAAALGMTVVGLCLILSCGGGGGGSSSTTTTGG